MKSRSKKAIINTIMALLLEVVTIICGFILPRLILSRFGSAYNGLTSSVTQFLACAVLLRSGIGGATRAALYRPIQEHDIAQINAIMSATNRFMKRIAAILAIMIICFACIYPLFVLDEFSYWFSFSLFMIMGIDTFFQSFCGITNYILLQAEQKNYIPALTHIFTYILNTVLSVILIECGFGIHIVKLGSAIAFSLYPIILALYVRKKYKVDFKVEPDNVAISQRWDAFWHQVAGFVMNNADTIILTIFSVMAEISVYSVYNMVFIAIKKLTKAFTDGLEAAFGSLMAEGKKEALKRNFQMVEVLIFDVATFVSICAGLLILQFVSIYTKGIHDVNYQRPVFAIVMVVAQFFNSVRQPYQLVVQAAGHYKETKKGAIIEPILNILISIVLVIRFGLVGVAIGTMVATIFRTVQFSSYVSKHLIDGVFLRMIKNSLISLLESLIVVGIVLCLPSMSVTTYVSWIQYAIVVAVITGIVMLIFACVFQKSEMKNAIKHVKK